MLVQEISENYTFVVKFQKMIALKALTTKERQNRVSDERALAKLSLNFRKSTRPPIFVREPGSPTRDCRFF